jgi:hypothetical protein
MAIERTLKGYHASSDQMQRLQQAIRDALWQWTDLIEKPVEKKKLVRNKKIFSDYLGRFNT